MALIPRSPTPARVRFDRRAGRPVSLRIGNEQLEVVALRSVRTELAAYPAARGPRITFAVETGDGDHATLVFDARRHRWLVEGDRAAA